MNQEVGLDTDPKTGEQKTVNVLLQYDKDGRAATRQSSMPAMTKVLKLLDRQKLDDYHSAGIVGISGSCS